MCTSFLPPFHLGVGIASRHLVETRRRLDDLRHQLPDEPPRLLDVDVGALGGRRTRRADESGVMQSQHPREVAVPLRRVQIDGPVREELQQPTTMPLADGHVEDMRRAGSVHRDQDRGGMRQRHLLGEGHRREVRRRHAHGQSRRRQRLHRRDQAREVANHAAGIRLRAALRRIHLAHLDDDVHGIGRRIRKHYCHLFSSVRLPILFL